jgi:glucose-1-phosphate thymidylyltransferase
MKCLLLGAGYATRLYPLTRERPKPLLPVAGIPMLQRIVERVNAVSDIDRIYVVTNHRVVGHYYNWLRDYTLQKGSLPKLIEIFDDLTTSPDDRLGAIGDIQFVIKNAKIEDDLLVISGDNLFTFDLNDFVAFARPKGSAVCLKDLKSKKLVSLYGAVEVDKTGKVVDFEEKPPKPATTLISVGVYHFAKPHLPLLGQYLEEHHKPDAPGYYLQWLHQEIDLYGYVIQGEWFDIGDIDSYNKANDLYSESKHDRPTSGIYDLLTLPVAWRGFRAGSTRSRRPSHRTRSITAISGRARKRIRGTPPPSMPSPRFTYMSVPCSR